LESRDKYSLQSYPPEVKKKVVLLLHFKNYMDNNSFKGKVPTPRPQLAQKTFVFIKKWMKTKHAIIFRMSNKLVQVNFEDGSELVMSSVSKKVRYLNKKGQLSCYLITNALDSGNTEMIKRLNYAR